MCFSHEFKKSVLAGMRVGSGGWEMVGEGQSDVMKLSIKLTNQGLGQGKGGRKREFSKLPASF